MSDVKETSAETRRDDPDEASAPPPPQPSAAVEDVPDPDEDYLDDLDDVLEEFSAPKSDVKTQPSQSAPSNSGEDQKSTKSPSAEEDEFAKELEAGMADLLDELAETPEMRQQFENLVKDLGQVAGAEVGSSGEGPSGPAAAAAGTRSETSTEGGAAGAGKGSFQDTIKRTMRRMQESNEQATAATASSDDPDDVLAEMLKQLQMSGGGGEGGTDGGADDNEEEFSKLLMGMMEQLTTKEILYAPMTELNEKFPAWMEKNTETVSTEDRRRYEEQRTLVGEIVARFEREGYSDANAEDREYIVERMQKMQAAGAPPAELVGNMDAAQGALDDLDAGCPQQ